MKPLVYVAGPYSQPDPAINVNRAVQVAAVLLDEGHVVPVLPHLTHLWHLIAPRSYEEWLAYDLHILAACAALYRMPGESAGADAEMEWAGRHDIPVFFSVPPLYEWATAL